MLSGSVDKEEVLKEFLRDTLRKVLKLRSSQEIPDDTGFFDLGMDSLMSVELKNKLQVAFGPNHTLSNTLAFD